MIGLLSLLLIGLLIAILAMTWFTIHTLTHPPRRTYASALSRGRPGDPSELAPARAFESWNLSWRTRDLPVWDIKGDSPEGPAIILSHGWGDSRIGGLSRVPALAPHASRIILWDMPGHGDAPGTCALGTREVDALLALIERIGRDREIVLYGWSLGAGVSIAAACRDTPIAAVIAEAPYRLPQTPARNVLRGFGYPWRINLPLALWMLGIDFGVGPKWRGFDRAVLAANMRAPLLVIHGEQDEVCPIEDGRTIAAAARAEFVIIPAAGHHGLWTTPTYAAACEQAVARFLFESFAQAKIDSSSIP